MGDRLKCPSSPIWVVCSESHFTVLFSLAPCPSSSSSLDLHYYDGLARQDGLVRLTVTPEAGPAVGGGQDKGLVSPLEHCIRTKWPGAGIGWNGTDPIL